MADPLSIGASVLAVVTAAIQSSKSLRDTVKRYKARNSTLRRLQEDLEDLINILNSLNEIVNVESSMLELLKEPILRCGRVCREFESSMEDFTRKSQTGFLDWAKMEFMRGDINEFLDTLEGYKATISVGLGTITMHNTRISHQVIEEYTELIKDTAYSLELHMQRIDEKLTHFQAESVEMSRANIDLEDEKAVTRQCLRICEDAKSYLESLAGKEPSLRSDTAPKSVEDGLQNQFEAQLLTLQALDNHRKGFVDIIGQLQKRLEALTREGASANERQRLQEDINASKQCLEVCKLASTEVNQQKIHCIGEAIADGESEQMVVTTLADLFDVRRALSKGRSMQFVGSTTDETLRQISDIRYNSRFGSMATTSPPPENMPANGRYLQQSAKERRSFDSEGKRSKPSSNETRKRATDGDI